MTDARAIWSEWDSTADGYCRALMRLGVSAEILGDSRYRIAGKLYTASGVVALVQRDYAEAVRAVLSL